MIAATRMVGTDKAPSGALLFLARHSDEGWAARGRSTWPSEQRNAPEFRCRGLEQEGMQKVIALREKEGSRRVRPAKRLVRFGFK